MADANDQNALTAEESALLSSMEQDAGTDAGPVDKAGAPATPAADAPAGSDAEGEKGGKDKTVPLSALHESRAEIKRLRDEAKAEKDARLLLEQRTNLILERLTPKAEKHKEPEVPDINTDPAGHLAAVLAKTGMTVEQLLERQRTEDTQREQNTQVGNLISWAGGQEREFTAATPDYNDAGAFLQQSRDAELAEMGYTDPAQRMQIIQNEKLAIANKAKLDGKNPAAIVYGMAKLRGYSKKAVPAAETPAVDAKARVENIDKGQKASESLTGTRGQGPAPLTATRLLEMSEAEFAKYVDTPEGRAVMGG